MKKTVYHAANCDMGLHNWKVNKSQRIFFHTTDNNGVCSLDRHLSKTACEIEFEISKKLRSNVSYMQIMNLHLWIWPRAWFSLDDIELEGK